MCIFYGDNFQKRILSVKSKNNKRINLWILTIAFKGLK